MTLVQYRFETGPQGTALTNVNSGSSAASIGSGSSAVFDAAKKAHGTYGARFINGAGATAYRRWDFAAPTTTWQASAVVTLPGSAPSENVTILSFPNSIGTGRVVIFLNPAMRLGIRGPGGANIADITNPLTGGGKYRISLQVVGGSATDSSVVAKVYSEGAGAWTTQVGATWSSSAFNTGTDAVIGVDAGVINAAVASYEVGWDDIQVNNGTGPEIDDLVSALSTPVVTLGATTNPSTVGGSNGTQVVTWGAVSGSSSYEAWRASGSSPAQGDFTRVATGVTSPYTFTGLSAGEYSFGIKAKA